MVTRRGNKKLSTNEIQENKVIQNKCQPILMENIERLSRSNLDRKIPRMSMTGFLNAYEHDITINNFNAFLKEYDNDSLIFNISLTNKDTYISSLDKRFSDERKKVLLDNNEKEFFTYQLDYCKYYINIIKSIPDDVFWVNELTSRKLRCFQKKCFGEIIFSPSIKLIKDNDVGSMKNIDCFVLHVPGYLYTASEYYECHKNAFIDIDLPYVLFNENKI